MAATLGKQMCQAQAYASAAIPSAIFIPVQDVRFEWQTSCQNMPAFAANGWLAFALGLILALAKALGKGLAEPEILLVGSELRVEQGIGDLALLFHPPTLQLNQFPLVFFTKCFKINEGSPCQRWLTKVLSDMWIPDSSSVSGSSQTKRHPP